MIENSERNLRSQEKLFIFYYYAWIVVRNITIKSPALSRCRGRGVVCGVPLGGVASSAWYRFTTVLSGMAARWASTVRPGSMAQWFCNGSDGDLFEKGHRLFL